MTKRRIFIAAMLFAATSSFAAIGDLPPGRWWRRPEIVNMLGLSAEQQEKLEAIYRTAAPDLIDAKADVDKQNIALRGELDAPQLDRTAIRAAGKRLNDARAKLFDRELMLLVDMRGTLTEPQWNRMRNELQKMRDNNDGGAQRPNGLRRPGVRPRQ
jgi:hypothetical protein